MFYEIYFQIKNVIKKHFSIEEKTMQKTSFDCTIYGIPIEDFEPDMDTESSKDKKKRILDLFRNHNELKSKDEY